MSDRIYKIVSREIWTKAEEAGVFQGAGIDLADGFIHFSAADQVVETAKKHFGGQSDLVLVTVEAARLGDQLKWEKSRGDALFPHVYGVLLLDAVISVGGLPLGEDGNHQFPSLEA